MNIPRRGLSAALCFGLGSGGLSAACPCAYIPNGGTNALKVLDLTSNTVTATIALGAFPRAAAVNPAGTRVYVTLPFVDGLAVVNATTNTLVTTIAAGFDQPGSVAIHPAGQIAYVGNTGASGGGAGTVSVVNLNNNTVLGTFPTGDTPAGLAVSPDGTRLFVANGLGLTVSVIDTTSGSTVTSLTGFNSPSGVATNLAGTRLYVSDTGLNQVRVYALPGLAAVTTLNVTAAPADLAVRPSGDRVHVAAGTVPGRLAIIDAGANTVMTTLTVGDAPAGVAFKPDGTRSYVPNSGSLSNSVTVVNATTNAIATTVTGLSAPTGGAKFIVSPPWAGSLSPTQAAVGGSGFTLTVNGSGFIAGSQVLWNGAARTTTFVNHTQLTAAIPAGDLAVPGTATLTVNNPAPAGGVSPTGLTFTICSGPPSPGNGLRLAKASPNLRLSWNPVTGATSYRVLACTAPISGACTPTLIGTPTAASYDDPVLGTASSYRYAIEAVNSCAATP